MAQLIDVYPYRLIGDASIPEFFVGKRAPGKVYADQWRMVGGKVIDGEKAWEAAFRELKEETGVVPVKFWSPPTLNQFYEPSSDTVHHIPVFAARLPAGAGIKLNEEHSDYKWITIDVAERYINWPEQLRIMQLIHQILTSQAILQDWIIPINK
ncbi:NUDIX domain-containing protein [Aliifodinibius sp. S!AR15-10]|uniref:NUDIX domain-containing protein n=1 Tax=Aliifodinibius sp. S!AR15-10 TaxID=2950437 RepID=UPI0028626EE7|nr:NUDIX domain-containing protein [Aliifodinibius sp. S!AR15-10]MDR8391037.1 NUDIX domain-containing protein [Aliifodinibius sp. S!AR15-10]